MTARTVSRRRTSVPSTRAARLSITVVGGALVLAGCSATIDSPLPGWSSIVDDDAPLTSAQADSVTTAAHSLGAQILAAFAAHDATLDDDSTEAWTTCVAKGTYPDPRAKFNGVSYVADLRFDDASPVTEGAAEAELAGVPIKWNAISSGKGTSDIFGIVMEGDPAQLRVTLTSPCYFVADTDDRLTDAQVEGVTGFLRRTWAR